MKNVKKKFFNYINKFDGNTKESEKLMKWEKTISLKFYFTLN